MIPGEYLLRNEDVVANSGRTAISISVANTGDRPIQVGSHFHFFEANRALRFDRGCGFWNEAEYSCREQQPDSSLAMKKL